jgi:hypothetical protein
MSSRQEAEARVRTCYTATPRVCSTEHLPSRFYRFGEFRGNGLVALVSNTAEKRGGGGDSQQDPLPCQDEISFPVHCIESMCEHITCRDVWPRRLESWGKQRFPSTFLCVTTFLAAKAPSTTSKVAGQHRAAVGVPNWSGCGLLL